MGASRGGETSAVDAPAWPLKALHFLRLTDPHDGLISLTNLAVIVAIAKVAQSHDPMVIAGAFATAVGGYGYKKFINRDSVPMSPGSPDAPPNP